MAAPTNLAHWRRRARQAAATLTPVGWTLIGVTLACWFVAAWLDWAELAVLATAGVVLLAVAALFMIGRTRLRVDTTVEPPRVRVGLPLTGQLVATNDAKVPLMATSIEFPIGEGGLTYDLPALLPGHRHSELFVVPTERRGVIPVGPVRTVRGDPLGAFRREQEWTEVTEVYVHPHTTALEPFGVGLIRDLEGTSSNEVSASDLAFHALREYIPGDDLRHIHWRSTARHGQLLVRQFLDTRRSHLVVLVDADPTMYDSEAEYELGLSVAGSLLRRGVLDEYDVSFLSGGETTVRAAGPTVLDACSRAVPESGSDLDDIAVRGARLVPDASLVVMITGPHRTFPELQRAGSRFGVDVGTVAARTRAGERASLRRAGDLPLLTLGSLEELPGLLRWGLR